MRGEERKGESKGGKERKGWKGKEIEERKGKERAEREGGRGIGGKERKVIERKGREGGVWIQDLQKKRKEALTDEMDWGENRHINTNLIHSN